MLGGRFNPSLRSLRCHFVPSVGHPLVCMIHEYDCSTKQRMTNYRGRNMGGEVATVATSSRRPGLVAKCTWLEVHLCGVVQSHPTSVPQRTESFPTKLGRMKKVPFRRRLPSSRSYSSRVASLFLFKRGPPLVWKGKISVIVSSLLGQRVGIKTKQF